MGTMHPKVKRVLITAMACLSAGVAVFSLAVKLPSSLGGEDRLSVLAAGFVAPEGARRLLTDGLPEESTAPSSNLSSEASSAPEASSSEASSQSQSSSSSSSQAAADTPAPPTDAGDLPYKGGTPEEGEATFPINERQIGPTGIEFENFSVKSTCETQIDIGEELSKRPDINIQKNGQPEVLIMHTHTCESYIDTDTGSYPAGYYPRTTDESFSVLAVGDAISERLNAAGIGTIHNKTVHDNPSYNGSYYRSEQTVINDLAENPGIQVVLDIHRDSLGNDETGKTKPTFIVDGKKAAQIMIIAGCDDDGTWDFPDWEYNLRFALQLQKTAETMYPGMTRPMQFCPSQYNMHLTHGSLLIEVGTDVNTVEEAVYSGQLLGDVLASVLGNLTN